MKTEADYIQIVNLTKLRTIYNLMCAVTDTFRNQRYGDARDLPSTYGIEQDEKMEVLAILKRAVHRIERTAVGVYK